MRLITLATAATLLASAAHAQSMEGMAGMDHAQMGHDAAAAQPAAPADAPMMGMDHSQMDHGAMAGMDHGMPAMSHAMSGALGAYPMTREASGTSWQPDASPHEMDHRMAGGWMVMSHAVLNGVYDRQEGPRGGDKTFLAGMIMGMARRELANGDTVGLNAMLSPDPFMGKRGYPLLLAAGESADGVTPLVDRQHPHDLFMELSASYSHRLSDADSVFVYAGLPGEPAFGPPTFMHRLSIMDSPEAPISHHWLDSTHITFGVVTGGFVHGAWKLEASAFKGREPDEDRFDIENPKLDSAAARLSWNPTPNWSLQGSWAHLKRPEALEPDADQRRLSASAIYTTRLGDDGWWSTTAAWGRRSSEGLDLDAFVLESAIKPNRAWTVFARAERTENNELLVSPDGHAHGPAYAVGKISAGGVRDWRISQHVTFGVGALYAFNFVPKALEASYGGDPNGAMAFVRLKLD